MAPLSIASSSTRFARSATASPRFAAGRRSSTAAAVSRPRKAVSSTKRERCTRTARPPADSIAALTVRVPDSLATFGPTAVRPSATARSQSRRPLPPQVSPSPRLCSDAQRVGREVSFTVGAAHRSTRNRPASAFRSTRVARTDLRLTGFLLAGTHTPLLGS